MKSEKIINLIAKLKEKIIVRFRNQSFELHKSKTYIGAYEGENEINTILVSSLEEMNLEMDLAEKLQYAVNIGRFQINFKGRFFDDYRSDRNELVKVM